jgi:pyridoxal phosphate enzyme (YggS family)
MIRLATIENRVERRDRISVARQEAQKTLIPPMTEEIRKRLIENLHAVRERIEAACARAGRASHEVTMIAVTKYAQLDWVRELVSLGVNDLGESRPQQLAQRAKELPSEIHWHMIGHLQRNKVEDIVPVASLVHSVDSVRLFEALAKEAKKRDRTVRVLLEANVSGEASKDGFGEQELLDAWPKLCECESLQIDGLMTMAPLEDNPEQARPVFHKLRDLRDRLRSECGGRWSLNHLSMGMSGDFEVGIEEGATFVRIGSRLFEGLSPQ